MGELKVSVNNSAFSVTITGRPQGFSSATKEKLNIPAGSGQDHRHVIGWADCLRPSCEKAFNQAYREIRKKSEFLELIKEKLSALQKFGEERNLKSLKISMPSTAEPEDYLRKLAFLMHDYENNLNAGSGEANQAINKFYTRLIKLIAELEKLTAPSLHPGASTVFSYLSEIKLKRDEYREAIRKEAIEKQIDAGRSRPVAGAEPPSGDDKTNLRPDNTRPESGEFTPAPGKVIPGSDAMIPEPDPGLAAGVKWISSFGNSMVHQALEAENNALLAPKASAIRDAVDKWIAKFKKTGPQRDFFNKIVNGDTEEKDANGLALELRICMDANSKNPAVMLYELLRILHCTADTARVDISPQGEGPLQTFFAMDFALSMLSLGRGKAGLFFPTWKGDIEKVMHFFHMPGGKASLSEAKSLLVESCASCQSLQKKILDRNAMIPEEPPAKKMFQPGSA